MIDYKYMATKEISAKARRLMTTPVFDGFLTQTDVSTPSFGSKPNFGRKEYDSRGHEKKVVVKDSEGGKKKEEEEQSFLSKYWLYIMMAMFILPRFFEAPQDGGEPGQAGPGSGGQAAAPARR